jgi:hypothetical protein
MKETLIDASKEFGLEINVEKIKYMLLSPRKTAGKNGDIKTANIWKCVTLQMFGDNINKSKFDSGGN